MHPMETLVCRSRSTPHRHPVGDGPARGDPRGARLRPALHRPHVRRRVDPRAGLARRARHAVRPALAGPGHRRPALRAGDLRGHEGLPARGRLGVDLPARGERRPHGALRAAARAARAARSRTSSRPSTRWSAPTSAGCRSRRGRRASTSGRSCSPPRRSSASGPSQHVTYMVIASPAGAYFAKGLKPVSIWLSEDYTRAGRGGMGAAKTGGNYASSLVAQQEAIEQGCDQVVFLDAAEGTVRRGARRHEPLLRPRRRHDRHPRAVRHDPRGHHPQLDHRAVRQARPPRRGAAGHHRRVARRRRLRSDHRGLRVRHRRRRDPGRHAEVARRRRSATGDDETGPVTQPGAAARSSTSSTAAPRTPSAGCTASSERQPGRPPAHGRLHRPGGHAGAGRTVAVPPVLDGVLEPAPSPNPRNPPRRPPTRPNRPRPVPRSRPVWTPSCATPPAPTTSTAPAA